MTSFVDPDSTDDSPQPPRRPAHPVRRRRRIGALLAVVAVAAIGVRAATLTSRHPAPARVAQTVPDTPQHRAPVRAGAEAAVTAADTAFTTVTGRPASLTAWRGRPTLLWFIVAGCASCGVSVPAVARHLDQIAASGVHIVTVDLYGDLPTGRPGLRLLGEFGQATAGARFTDPTWTWGVASKQLSYRYDASGTPDVYVLLDGHGRVVYRGSVPVTSMSSLLHHIQIAAAPAGMAGGGT